MKKEDINEIRKIFIDELKNYEGEPILFDKIDKNILDKIIFDYNEKDGKMYKTIAKEIYSVLGKIDFKNISFDNAKVMGEDFESLYNVRINPQTVYKKDLSNSYFKNVTFIGSFDGVFDGIEIDNVNFKGSSGAVINPQLVKNKNLSHSNYADVTFVRDLSGTNIAGSSFKGSVNAVIDPQLVKDKDLRLTNLKDAIVIDDFEGVLTYGELLYDEELLIDREGTIEKEEKEDIIVKIKEHIYKR